MNYQEAIRFLFSSLPMYQRVGTVAYKSTLSNTEALDEYFGHPHRHYRSIHIAGTNGKGSVAHMLAAICQSAGYKTGLYTSPHLKDFRERIRVNGAMIPEEDVTRFVNDHKEIIDGIKPSFFEMTVAMAFDHFAQEKVDIAVVEVGMGGRLDSTNIIQPVLSIITNIGPDHSQFLGDTLYKIATEKAGIIKSGVPVIVGQEQDEVSVVFKRKAGEMDCELFFADREYKVEYALRTADEKQVMQVYRDGKPWMGSLKLDQMGLYQQKNAITVLKAVEMLNELGLIISEDHLRNGLGNTRGLTGLRGRWEILRHNPLVICDSAHNPDGIAVVLEQLKHIPWKRLHIVLGLVDDKDPGEMLRNMPRDAVYYFTHAGIPRAMDKEKLASKALKYGLYGRVCPSGKKAMEMAVQEADPEDLVFIGGSTFLVAEIL
jgi:dihydrofolate synthase/folylpolyglutamate synthase